MDWTLIPTNVSPDPSHSSVMAYDPVFHRMILHRSGVFELGYLSTWPDEVCDTSIDHDLDGLVACDDPDCEGKPCAGGGVCSGGVCQ